jgi:predicted transcriptional regulator
MLSTKTTEFKPVETGYKFIRLPKNASLLLNGNERSLFGVMVDYQQMIDQQNNNKGNDFPMAISYICQNLDISDKTAQSSINKLIELNLIIKHSGYRTRTKNIYSINFDKIREFDAMKSDQLFELREKLRKVRSPKPEEPVVSVKLPEVQQPTEALQQEPQPKYSTEVFQQIKAMRDGLFSTESYSEDDSEDESNYYEVDGEEEDYEEYEDGKIEESVLFPTVDSTDEKKLIDEFEYFLNEKESRVTNRSKLYDIMPNKYRNPREKQVILEYVNSSDFSKRVLKNEIIKILS